MKRVLLTICLIFLGANSTLWGQELTAQQIIQKVNDLLNQKSVYSKVKMIIQTSSGQLRTFEYESWAKNGSEKSLIRYTAPRRVKGQAILMLNNADDIWMYFPRTNRVRKLATHAKRQKMEGSDFSYEDMGSGNAFVEQFTPKLLGKEKMEGYDCYKLELIRKPGSNSAYAKLVMWVIKDNFYPVVIDYYEEKYPERIAKRLIQRDIKMVQNVPTAMKMVMKNLIDNTQTVIEFLEVQYNVKLDDKMFTVRGLKK